MPDPLNEEKRRQLEEEWRNCVEQLDRAEREFFEAMESTRAQLDREIAAAKVRFAAARVEAEKRYAEIKGD